MTVIHFIALGLCLLHHARLSAADTDDSCVDASSINVDGVITDCYGLIDIYGPAICVDLYAACCATCGTLEVGNPDCPYGDLQSFTVEEESHTCDSVIEDYTANTACLHDTLGDWCCDTCQDFETGEQACPYGDLLYDFILNDEAHDCASSIAMYGADGLCADETMQEICCGTCLDFATGDPDCPYGDLLYDFILNDDPHNCASSVDMYGANVICKDETMQEICCGTCLDLATGDPNCPYGNSQVSITVNDIPGFTCDTAYAAYGSVLCDNPIISAECCESCPALAVDIGRK